MVGRYISVDLPPGHYDPKKELRRHYPKMQALADASACELSQAVAELARREKEGRDTSYARTAFYEAHWRINQTSDDVAAGDSVERLRKALACDHPPDALTQDADGSFAYGTGDRPDAWFLKLQRSTDQLLARTWPWPRSPAFLVKINDPAAMVTYLQDRCWSDVVRRGRDNRTELNEALSVIARLVVKGGQAGYLSGPNFYPGLAAFIQDWQDPVTGFFGMAFILEDQRKIRIADLSMTFHMVHYVPHLVRWWPRLIDTLLAMKHQDEPEGWPENGTITNHNNYDVAMIFYRAWPHVTAQQRQAASAAIGKMLDWCLKKSVTPDGEVCNPDEGDPVPDSYYFAAAFLNTVGFFDRTKRFWTGDLLPDPDRLKSGMIEKLKKFDPDYTGVDDTLEQLGAKTRPWSNAIL